MPTPAEDQAPQPSESDSQTTPSRSYGRQDAADGTRQDVEDASAAETIGAGQDRQSDAGQRPDGEKE